MKRITRNRPLNAAEIEKYDSIRKKIDQELPELLAQFRERLAPLEELPQLLKELKAAREAQGLSLQDITDLTDMDPSALSKLESGQRTNPTVETLVRYARAVGKRLVVGLRDAGCREMPARSRPS